MSDFADIAGAQQSAPGAAPPDGSSSRRAGSGFGVYLVTDTRLCGDRGVVQTVRAAVAGGVRTVQFRDKVADGEAQLRAVEELAAVLHGRALLLVNDRLDVAVAARRRGIPVAGVHLGQGDIDPQTARALLGPSAVIGLTADTPAHLATIATMPRGTIDYLGVGAIHPTTTKIDHPPTLGIDGYARFAAASALPTIPIGGIRLADVAPLCYAGAAGVAVVSAICAADDPELAAREFAAEWNRHAPQSAPPPQVAD